MIAEAVCLDFINTIGDFGSDEASEPLEAYATLVEWGRREGLFSAEEAARLAQDAGRRPEEVKAALARTLTLRDALHALFTTLLEGHIPAVEHLETLNVEIACAHEHMELTYAPDDGFIWRWTPATGALDQALWPVARSAEELLLSPTLAAVRQCASETCGWLFIDTTKNRSRRWCDMGGCGNRAKARRHRARQRKVQGDSAVSP